MPDNYVDNGDLKLHENCFKGKCCTNCGGGYKRENKAY